jgi:hypothetical protein
MGSGKDPHKKVEAYGLLAGPEATFYGEAAMSQEFTSRTIAGLALYLVLYGIIGALFGLTLASQDASFRTTLIGVLVGFGWYYLSFAILWQNINPLIILYTHRGAAGGAAPHAEDDAA